MVGDFYMSNNQIHVCSHCDAQYPKWQGQCGECGKWGTIKSIELGPGEAQAGTVLSLDVNLKTASRLSLGLSEVENVLGGGVVPGSLILLSGDPGIGKSTLVLQIALGLIKNTPGEIIYVCGEESPEQISLRLQRLQASGEKLKFLTDTATKNIIATVKKHKPRLVIVDSIQTLFDDALPSEAGSVAQIRAATGQLLQLAKNTNVPIIIIGHVTKDGVVSGPRLLEHMVDVVLYLEGDGIHEHRLLRSVKNRFGATNQVGVFSMEEQGLVEVKNPSQLFLNQTNETYPGSVVSVIMEGNRPFLVEVQALTNKTSFGYPKRTAAGFDSARLELIVAVLSRRAGLKLDNQDIFLNLVGGLKSKDPALDLAAAMAIASSLSNQNLPKQSVVLGEVGLGGEIRPVPYLEARLSEARRLGFKNFYTADLRDIKNTLAVLGIEK